MISLTTEIRFTLKITFKIKIWEAFNVHCYSSDTLWYNTMLQINTKIENILSAIVTNFRPDRKNECIINRQNQWHLFQRRCRRSWSCSLTVCTGDYYMLLTSEQTRFFFKSWLETGKKQADNTITRPENNENNMKLYWKWWLILPNQGLDGVKLY